jgi:hypothetical protein
MKDWEVMKQIPPNPTKRQLAKIWSMQRTIEYEKEFKN